MGGCQRAAPHAGKGLSERVLEFQVPATEFGHAPPYASLEAGPLCVLGPQPDARSMWT